MPFAIVGEQAGEPYRVARVAPRPERTEDPTVLESVRNALISKIEQAEQDAVVLHARLPPETFINSLSKSIDLVPLEKHTLLECETGNERRRRLFRIFDV